MEKEKILLERLHIRVFDDYISVLYRPTHTYIAFLPNNEEGKKELKKLATINREDFSVFLFSQPSIMHITPQMVSKSLNSDLEKWYKSAWQGQTNEILSELEVENPIEEPIYKN